MGLKFDMRVIAVSTLTEFWCVYPSAKAPLMVGLTVARNAKWARWPTSKPSSATPVLSGSGGEFSTSTATTTGRWLPWPIDVAPCNIKFVGTLAQYDAIDTGTVEIES